MNNGEDGQPPVVLDAHRGMAAQVATEARRHLSEVEADQQALREARDGLGVDALAARRDEIKSLLEKVAGKMEDQDLKGETRRDDLLDKPVLRTLIRQLQQGQHADSPGAGGAGDVYEHFGR